MANIPLLDWWAQRPQLPFTPPQQNAQDIFANANASAIGAESPVGRLVSAITGSLWPNTPAPASAPPSAPAGPAWPAPGTTEVPASSVPAAAPAAPPAAPARQPAARQKAQVPVGMAAPLNPPDSGDQVAARQSRWRQWLSVPQNRAALIQFGVNLAQPVALGQNTLGHIGQAVGAAGEAAGRVTGQEIKATEAASKQNQRAVRAELAAQKLKTAGAGAGTAAARLALARERMNAAKSSKGFTQRLQLQREYRLETDAIKKRNANAEVLGQPTEPVPTFNDWVKANPQLTGGAADPYEGRTIVNPTTGEQLVRRNGQWTKP